MCSAHRSRGILNPVVRSQVTGVLFFKQRNYLELQAFLEEHGAMLPDRNDLERIYRLATDEPYQFLYVNLRATDVNDMFFIGFSKRIRVNAGSREMEADPYSNRTRDEPSVPVQGDLPRPAEAVVMTRHEMQPRQYGRERGNATPAQLQHQGTLRKAVPSGL